MQRTIIVNILYCSETTYPKDRNFANGKIPHTSYIIFWLAHFLKFPNRCVYWQANFEIVSLRRETMVVAKLWTKFDTPLGNKPV